MSMSLGQPDLDMAVFRGVMGRFATGVTVIAALEEGQPVGFTCQSFVSLSLDPPLIAICPAKNSTSWPRMVAARKFSVNILAAGQEVVCANFARSGDDKFSGVDWYLGIEGTPILKGVVASIECELALIHEAGDHELVIGKVLSLEADDRSPLVYFRSRFGSFSLEP